MIYIKIKNQLYNKNNIEKIKTDFPLYYNRLKAIYRIINIELNETLKEYPEIDIYINTKSTKRLLGSFRARYSKEYNIKNKNPYIILYPANIENNYLKHNVKGLQSVLYHEYGHFKQWLLNFNIGHNRKIKSQATDKAKKDLKRHLEYATNFKN